MFPALTVIFLVVPVVEIFLLIQVGEVIGAWWTVGLVVLTAVIGVRLLKYQGLSTLMRAQGKMQGGQMPAQELLEGVGLIVAGAFLLTPGFFTDAVGFCLLIPQIRLFLVSRVVANMAVSNGFSPGTPPTNPYDQSKRDIIDGVRYKRED